MSDYAMTYKEATTIIFSGIPSSRVELAYIVKCLYEIERYQILTEAEHRLAVRAMDDDDHKMAIYHQHRGARFSKEARDLMFSRSNWNEGLAP